MHFSFIVGAKSGSTPQISASHLKVPLVGRMYRSCNLATSQFCQDGERPIKMSYEKSYIGSVCLTAEVAYLFNQTSSLWSGLANYQRPTFARPLVYPMRPSYEERNGTVACWRPSLYGHGQHTLYIVSGFRFFMRVCIYGLPYGRMSMRVARCGLLATWISFYQHWGRCVPLINRA